MTTNSFQPEDTKIKEIFQDDANEDVYGGSISLFNYLAGAGETIPPWWSQGRDSALKQLVKNSDHLSGTVATIVEMIMTIPHQVLPRNARIKSHIKQAEMYQDIIDRKTESRSSKIKTGFTSAFAPFIQDVLSTDNGGFMAIEGPGNDALTGMPTKLVHLDSTHCMRTSSSEWPVIFTDRGGKRYKIHKTRLINITQQPDASVDMLGVGFCSVSRCINAVQNLIDMARYKQEKLGSRPTRALLHIQDGGNREVAALDGTLQKYAYLQDAQGFARYGKIPIFASKGTLNLIDFASLPDGFDELTGTQLDMAVLAMAFGVDSRQLAFALGVSGQTRADAQVQHEKMKGKGPGFLMKEIERLLDEFFLPDYLMFKFDYQDDSQDKAQAENRDKRATTRKTNLESGVTDVAIERENMVRDGDLTQEQFEALQAQPEIEPEIIEVEEEVKAKTYQPPKAAQGNARKVLRWRKEHPNEIRGMTQVGWTRARQLASGKPISLDIAKRMAAFNRHRQNAEVDPKFKSEPWRDAGYVAWLGWGGTTGIDWAIGVSQANKEKKYASTQFNMPVWVTRLCAEIASQIDREDVEEIEHDSHITLKYGITHNDPMAIAEAVKDFDDLQLEFAGLSLFENDNDVLKVDIVLSNELRRLYDAIADTGSDDLYNGEYNPHLTIAYLKKGTGQKYLDSNLLNGQRVTVDSVAFSTTDRTIVNIPLGQRVKSLSSFTASINANARALYNQEFDLIDFIAAMGSTIDRGYNQAWVEGARGCGIEPSERTSQEQFALNDQIANAKSYIYDLGKFIESKRDKQHLIDAALVAGTALATDTNTKSFSDLQYRLDLWTNRYNEVMYQAKTMACQDQKLEWQVSAGKKHCSTCSRLAGRVMRASRWKELDIYPRDTRPGKLECNGFKCGCSLVETTKRATPGRLPTL